MNKWPDKIVKLVQNSVNDFYQQVTFLHKRILNITIKSIQKYDNNLIRDHDMNKINFCLKMILHYLGTLNQCCPPMSIQCTITILTKKKKEAN